VNNRAFDDWAAAQRELAEAEIEVVRWQLHENTPVPDALHERVAALRDRAEFLFDVASTQLASPNDTDPTEL
jgi:hypothetical protein